MPNLLITNRYNCHYEIVESILCVYSRLVSIPIHELTTMNIFLDLVDPDKSFKKYILSRFPDVTFGRPDSYTYYIDITLYNEETDLIEKSSTSAYIAHEYSQRLAEFPNVFYITPLAKHNYFMANALPYRNNMSKSEVPIFIVQGNLNHGRRNYQLLKNILNKNYGYSYTIKLVGRGHFPTALNGYEKQVVLRNNLNFVEFHREFMDAYCIITLTDPKSNPRYYKDKLTSSISYAIGYNLKCIIDKPLNNIYHLKNAIVYNNENDISSAFQKSLEDFYGKKEVVGIFIEPRKLKQVQWNIVNFFRVLPDTPLYFFCGKNLKPYWDGILSDFEDLHIIELPVENLNFQTYSDTMKDIKFWDHFNADYCITIQTDGCLCKNSPYNINEFFQYDYVGGYAPQGWWWKETKGLHKKDDYQCFNGGFSIRNIHACRSVLRRFPPQPSIGFRKGNPMESYAEDLYFVCGMLKLKYNVGLDKHATKFCSHTDFTEPTFCIHNLKRYKKGETLQKALAYATEYQMFLQPTPVEN